MKQENEKKLYEAPALTAVTFKAEKGYAASSNPLLLIALSGTIQSEPSSLVYRDGYGTANSDNWNFNVND